MQVQVCGCALCKCACDCLLWIVNAVAVVDVVVFVCAGVHGCTDAGVQGCRGAGRARVNGVQVCNAASRFIDSHRFSKMFKDVQKFP